VEDVRGEPVLAAFESVADPHDLIDRWRRLERFAHSRHRVEVVEASKTSVTLRHFAPRSAEPPRAEEDLLILGALIGLMREIGVADLRAKFAGELDWSHRAGWLRAPADLSETALWRIEWAGMVGDAACEPDLNELAKVLSRDLSKRWSVREAARALGLSARSLQRALAAEGRTFSEVVAETRAAAAVRMLRDEALSLGQIGFLCGYADQAHFTRSFRAAIAATPGAFRESLKR
ncbi:MAG: helix-turn-helix transcriptional regulator, partial [Pseudomonadota bacterium]